MTRSKKRKIAIIAIVAYLNELGETNKSSDNINAWLKAGRKAALNNKRTL